MCRKEWKYSAAYDKLICWRSNYLCWMKSMDEGLWVTARWWWTSFVTNLTNMNIHSISFTQSVGNTYQRKVFLFVLKLCAFQHFNKRQKKSQHFPRERERILVLVFQLCGRYPKHRGQRPHMGFGYYSCFVSCLFV